jgi:hypothetical protein
MREISRGRCGKRCNSVQGWDQSPKDGIPLFPMDELVAEGKARLTYFMAMLFPAQAATSAHYELPVMPQMHD